MAERALKSPGKNTTAPPLLLEEKIGPNQVTYEAFATWWQHWQGGADGQHQKDDVLRGDDRQNKTGQQHMTHTTPAE